MTRLPRSLFAVTLRWLIIVPGGLITSPRGGPGGPGTGFYSPGGGFSDSRRSGKPLRLLRLKKPPLGLQKPVPGPPGPPLYSLVATPIRLLDLLESFAFPTIFFRERQAPAGACREPTLYLD